MPHENSLEISIYIEYIANHPFTMKMYWKSVLSTEIHCQLFIYYKNALGMNFHIGIHCQ